MSRHATAGGAEGSVLLETLIGIGILTLVTSTLVTFNHGWLKAAEASEVRTAGLELASAHVEGHALAEVAADTVRTVSGVHPLNSTVTRWERGTQPDACGPGSPAGASGVVVAVKRGEPTGGGGPGDGDPVVELRVTRLEASAAREVLSSAAVTGNVVQIDDAPAGLSVHVASGEQDVWVTPDATGCLRLPPLAPGRHVLRPVLEAAGAELVDTAQRSGEQLQLDMQVLDRPVARTWRLSLRTEVSVGIDTSGARAPDVVSTGALQWLVRGDDARTVTALGAARPLHPGPATVVVSVCSNPDALASSASVEVAPGDLQHVLVPLATVTLDGIGTRSGSTIIATRRGVCGDGSIQQPRIAWQQNLQDGMRIALPHGEWDAYVHPVVGARRTVVIRAGETEGTVTLP